MTRVLHTTDLVALVERVLPARLRPAGAPGVWRGQVGTPPEMIVVVDAKGIDFRPCAIGWCTPHDPVPTSRPFVHLDADDVPASQSEAEKLVRHLAEAARIVRRGQYLTCRQCNQLTPPERMHDPDVCQDCADARGGAAF